MRYTGTWGNPLRPEIELASHALQVGYQLLNLKGSPNKYYLLSVRYYSGASLVAQMVKNLSAMPET